MKFFRRSSPKSPLPTWLATTLAVVVVVVVALTTVVVVAQPPPLPPSALPETVRSLTPEAVVQQLRAQSRSVTPRHFLYTLFRFVRPVFVDGPPGNPPELGNWRPLPQRPLPVATAVPLLLQWLADTGDAILIDGWTPEVDESPMTRLESSDAEVLTTTTTTFDRLTVAATALMEQWAHAQSTTEANHGQTATVTALLAEFRWYCAAAEQRATRRARARARAVYTRQLLLATVGAALTDSCAETIRFSRESGTPEAALAANSLASLRGVQTATNFRFNGYPQEQQQQQLPVNTCPAIPGTFSIPIAFPTPSSASTSGRARIATITTAGIGIGTGNGTFTAPRTFTCEVDPAGHAVFAEVHPQPDSSPRDPSPNPSINSPRHFLFVVWRQFRWVAFVPTPTYKALSVVDTVLDFLDIGQCIHVIPGWAEALLVEHQNSQNPQNPPHRPLQYLKRTAAALVEQWHHAESQSEGHRGRNRNRSSLYPTDAGFNRTAHAQLTEVLYGQQWAAVVRREGGQNRRGFRAVNGARIRELCAQTIERKFREETSLAAEAEVEHSAGGPGDQVGSWADKTVEVLLSRGQRPRRPEVGVNQPETDQFNLNADAPELTELNSTAAECNRMTDRMRIWRLRLYGEIPDEEEEEEDEENPVGNVGVSNDTTTEYDLYCKVLYRLFRPELFDRGEMEPETEPRVQPEVPLNQSVAWNLIQFMRLIGMLPLAKGGGGISSRGVPEEEVQALAMRMRTLVRRWNRQTADIPHHWFQAFPGQYLRSGEMELGLSLMDSAREARWPIERLSVDRFARRLRGYFRRYRQAPTARAQTALFRKGSRYLGAGFTVRQLVYLTVVRKCREPKEWVSAMGYDLRHGRVVPEVPRPEVQAQQVPVPIMQPEMEVMPPPQQQQGQKRGIGEVMDQPGIFQSNDPKLKVTGSDQKRPRIAAVATGSVQPEQRQQQQQQPQKEPKPEQQQH